MNEENKKPKFKFNPEARAWQGDEVWEKYSLTPEKMELIEGKLFWTDEQRENMLGLMLEMVGTDKAVALGGFSGAMAFEKSLRQYWARGREYTLLNHDECEYFEDDDLPVLVLGLEHVYPVHTGFQWRKIAHQTAGLACHQHYLFGIQLPVKADVLPKLKYLSEKYLDSNHWQPAPLSALVEYSQFMANELQVTCENSYHSFEEAYYPIDATSENLKKLSSMHLPDNLNDLLNFPADAPKFRPFTRWHLVVLGENCD
jgi:hypothetical protein